MNLPDILSSIDKAFPEAVLTRTDFRGETTLELRPEHLRPVLALCHSKLAFDYLLDISSLDHLGDDPRFELVYELSSMQHHLHLRIRAKVSEEHLSAPTVSDLWPTADWHEREIYDMMGIRFDGHPDLRRILMWEGFPHFPLRKDFPLEGKSSDVPDVAFTAPAPLEGGPFVTVASGAGVHRREPRARRPE